MLELSPASSPPAPVVDLTESPPLSPDFDLSKSPLLSQPRGKHTRARARARVRAHAHTGRAAPLSRSPLVDSTAQARLLRGDDIAAFINRNRGRSSGRWSCLSGDVEWQLAPHERR